MKTQAAKFMDRTDSIVAFFAGGVGGMYAWIEFYLLDASYFIGLMKAGATAAVCGFLGVAGKHCFTQIKQWWNTRKRK